MAVNPPSPQVTFSTALRPANRWGAVILRAGDGHLRIRRTDGESRIEPRDGERAVQFRPVDSQSG